MDAAELVPGDLVYRKNWQISPVQRVTIITLSEPVEVFNFEVEDCHTYFIGDGCWIVHNACTKAAQRGTRIHNKWNYGQNGTTFRKEVRLGTAGRADAVDFANHIVYELKPNNTRAIRQGWQQLNRYVKSLEELEPGSQWIKILITY